MKPLRTHVVLSSMLAAGIVAASLSLLSFAYGPPVHSEEPRASSVEAFYAPFDSIRTDIEDYNWPINAPPKITSSFAEFRSSHFHAGIDIGTGNKIGVEVYASRDGYVARIEVSPYGYGRYLVLRHADGFYTTYAHLSAFKNKLERAVRAEQLKQGKFSIKMKFQPGEYPVRKGDVVAYSGESGTGDAHLHFEIRDENFNPVNPLLFPNIRRFTDTEPPIIRHLAVTPMDEYSFVDYDFSPKVYTVHARSASSYTVAEVIRGTGSLGFSIDAADRVNNTRYRSSVYAFEFQVDGTTIFTSQRNRFPEDETRQVGVDFDWALWKEKRGRFQKLYVDEGNTLPFYNRRNEFDGVVALKNFSEGLHHFKIIASDYSGNSSELTGAFVLNHPPTVEISRVNDESVTVYLPHSRNVAAVEIGTKTFSSRQWNVENYDTRTLELKEDSLSLPGSLDGADVVRAVARNIWGTRSFPVYYFLKRPPATGKAELSSDVDGSFLRVWIESGTPFSEIPSLQAQQGNITASIPLRAIDMNNYSGVYRLSPTFSGMVYLKAFCEIAGKQSEVFDSFSLTTISPDREGTIQSDDGNMTVTFEPGTVYAPLHPTIEKISETRYDVQPGDVLLQGAIKATLRYPEEYESDKKIAMYVNNGGGWKFLATDRVPQTHTLTLRNGHTLGTFGILRDEQPPKIKRWRASSFNVKGRPVFSFSVRDNLSGVDDDEINVFLNGVRVIPEYDPEKKIVFYIPLDPLPRGHYSVQVEVKDRVGNAAHLARTFSVYR
ncbi:MAG: M23 family metallopeptidase [Bacteroidota bacterium]